VEVSAITLGRWLIAVSLLGLAGWLTVTQLIEAFGSGPPYYAQTTNMDKWDNPIPFLIAMDLGVLAVVVLLLAPGRLRKIRGHSSTR
jgi:hypothetical protein